MARAIIRYSFTGEKSNASGTAVTKALERVGFEKQGRTACWEVDGVPFVLIRAALLEVLEICEKPIEADGRLDHLWIYVDDPSASD
jgi:hypothetical protein